MKKEKNKDEGRNFLGKYLPKKKSEKKLPKSETSAGNGTVMQSYGNQLGRIAAYAVVAMLVIGATCGFLAFFSPAPQPVMADDPAEDKQTQQAGAYAQSFVSAWLEATNNDREEIESYYSSTNNQLNGKAATEYRDLTTGSVEITENGLVTVTVAADIKTTEGSGDDATTKWVPTWYQVSVVSTDDGYSPTGYPAPIAAPEKTDRPSLGYENRASSSDLADTMETFFAAYAAGDGDVTRYSSPDSDIRAITPAYWESVKVRSIQTKERTSDNPPETGQTVSALVNVELTRGDDSRPAEYALTLVGRDGRWEVSQIDSAPQLSANS